MNPRLESHPLVSRPGVRRSTPRRVRDELRKAFFTAVTVVVAALAVETIRAEERKDISIADLAWLAGSWSVTEGELTVEEHWTKPSRNIMLGMGRTIRGGKTILFEYLRVESRDDGIYYVAHPNAAQGTDFKLTSFDGRRAIFENPANDYPKRILYRRETDGSVTAVIDAGKAEPPESVKEFKYRALER